MVFFQGLPSFGGLPRPPILARSIGPDGWSVPMDRDEWVQYCAQVWNDYGPLNENANWIPAGENRQQFIQLVLNPPNTGYGSGGGIPSEAEPSAVDYQDNESNDESDDESDDEESLSEEEDAESDAESDEEGLSQDDDFSEDDGFSVEEDDGEPVQGLLFMRISGPN